MELRFDNENCFIIKLQGQSPKCKISETSQVNEIVKNTQLSHSCTIDLSVCRCQGNEMQNYRNGRYFGIDLFVTQFLRSIKQVELEIFIRSNDSPTEWNCVVIMKTVLP